MDYHLSNNWSVIVSLKLTDDGHKYDFSFDFIVDINEKWPEIISTAKTIIKEKFGHSGYEIISVSLLNKE